MNKKRLLIGAITVDTNGNTINETKEVEFIGEKLGEHHVYGYDFSTGKITTARFTRQVVYRTDTDRLIRYTMYVSDWVHDPETYTIEEVTEADLSTDGKYEILGRYCGFGSPITLDEALDESS